MQKKIIALAVAGLVSGVAFAQTNVTVYGLIDQAYYYGKSDSGRTGVDDYKYSGIRDGGLSGSRIGFRGEEGLGNGLKAIFTVEWGKEADNNFDVNGLTNRQSFVGLTSANVGTFTVGRQYNAVSMFYAKNTSNDVTGVMPVNSLQGQNASQIRSGGGNARQDNVIKYVSPNWSGFTVAANYSFGESNQTYDSTAGRNNDHDTSTNGRYSIAADYSNGPINISAGYAVIQKLRGNNGNNIGATLVTTGNTGDDVKEWFIGGAYDFKVVKLHAMYQDLSNKSDAALTVTDQSMWSVGLSAPIGNNSKAYIEYARLDQDTDNLPNGPDGASKGWGIGYEYYMSKRTTLYTQISQIKHDNDVVTTGSWVTGMAARGEKQTNVLMGIRHTF